MKKLLIIGAGGHGKVVADAALESQQWHEICFLDDDDQMQDGFCKIIGNISQLPKFMPEFSIVVAIGDNKKREQVLLWANNLGCKFGTIVHPHAFVSKYSDIGYGVVVCAQAVVNAFSKIDFGCIVNSGAVVEHHCVLDECVHISPNAALAGGVKVGKCAWIGIGSNVIENINIGSNSIVGAGAVVINDIPNNTIVVGNPAKVIKLVK